MSKYTTGEIAKLTGVTVRTVQYYDDRGILIPSELSEGGRRLYSDDDLRRMKIIGFLREAGLPIKSIEALFADENPESIISVLLAEGERQLEAELSECTAKLEIIKSIKRELREVEAFSVESIGDIAEVMKQKDKLSRMRLNMLLTGIPLSLYQIASVVLWITNGLWWLFVIWAAVAIPWGIAVSAYYYKHTAYICPKCHKTFKPKFKEAFFAYHTPKMRRLTCPECGYTGLCVEVYDEAKDK